MKKLSRSVFVYPAIALLLGAVHAQSASMPDTLPLAATPTLVVAAQRVRAEPTAATPDPEAATHFGLRYADFVQANDAMMDTALEDPAIVDLTRQIEALVAQREALIIEAACRKHPEAAEKIRAMQQNVTALRMKKADQDKQAIGSK